MGHSIKNKYCVIMSGLSMQDIVNILEGRKPTHKTTHRGYCTSSSSSSIINATLRRQTGIVPQSYNPKALEAEAGEEEQQIKKPKKSKKDLEFKEYLRKYLENA